MHDEWTNKIDGGWTVDSSSELEIQGELNWEGVTTSTIYSSPILNYSLALSHDDFCTFNGECKAMQLYDFTKACIFCKYMKKIDIPKIMEGQNS